MSAFNDDISWWLSSQVKILKDNDVQKILYEIETEELENMDITFRQKEILKTTISAYLKLSFILKNNPQEAEKLIEYLS